MTSQPPHPSTTSAALSAAGDSASAQDIGALDTAALAVEQKLAATERSLVERLIYGPQPSLEELQSGGRMCAALEQQDHPVLKAALEVKAHGKAFTNERKLSPELRKAMAESGAYGLTVPKEFGGRGETYLQLAHVEEALSANGLGPMAVEISGELTIGAGSLLGYGNDEQRRLFLPMVAEGNLMGFALTEVATGVNAKKVQAYVDRDENGDYRLFADGPRNKLWITSATYGSLIAVVARIGQTGRELGLFITQLPDRDIEASEAGWEFRCQHSGVDAFKANFNSRLHFYNYPIPAANRVPGDGVEVLFYSLRLGRCMLAAMSAGHQRMLARDASNYAKERLGVGGPVIKHELPQLAIGRMLGGSLQAKALSYLSLSQDAARIDLAGLRDLTKSAAAETAMDAMRACEHVLGGRAFANGSRVNAARADLHLFGIVEGEDDMIRMGMVRDITTRFVDRYLAPMLGQLQAANVGPDGTPLPVDQRILRMGIRQFLRFPGRYLATVARIAGSPATYRLAGWIAGNALHDLPRALFRLLPTSVLPRYKNMPSELREHVRYAERELRFVRWRYLRLSIMFQLELTSAQIALKRLGQQIEQLVSIVALCNHAAVQDQTQWHVADLQCLVLREQIEALKAGLRTGALRRLSKATAAVGREVADDSTSMFKGLAPEPYAHPFKE